MSKGTIIYVGGFELPDMNAAAHRVMSNAKLFRKLGYSVVFIGTSKDPKLNKDILSTKQVANGFTYFQAPYPKSKKEWFKHLYSIDEFLFVIKKYRNIKAVICYNYQALAFERIRKYCVKNNIKVISDCTEWYGKSEGNIVFRLIKYLDTTLRMKVINKKVDSLIVVSKYLRKYYGNKDAVVIPTLVERKNENNSNYHTVNETTKLIYAGIPFRLGKTLKERHLAKDRLDIAIKLLYSSYQKGLKFKFEIYGITKEEYVEVLPEDKFMIDKMENQISFYGRCSNIEVQKNISKADFSVLIRDDNKTTKAGFPTKFAESLSLGVPVITTKTSDLETYLFEEKNGFFLDVGRNDFDEEKFYNIISLSYNKKREMKEYCLKSDTFNIDKWLDECRSII
jgi:glycosyltransferase involved in cell wall biosynthesis